MSHHPPPKMPHHTMWFKVRRGLRFIAVVVSVVAIFIACLWGWTKFLRWASRPTAMTDAAELLQAPLVIEVKSTYVFLPEDGTYKKVIKNVGLTFYSRNDGYTPGHTTRSGRFVCDGYAAVSQPMWQKEVWAGDLIWVKATNRWYRVEDTMHEKYAEPRIDIYTHDMAVANSGSSKTDILIVRLPR